MPQVIIMSGLPGSGKSTFRKVLLAMYPQAVVCSSDDYIEEIAESQGKTYSEVFRENIEAANTFFFQSLEKAVLNQETVIIDRTNLTKASRKKIFDTIKTFGLDYTVDGYEFETSHMGIIYERAKNREKTGKIIPVHVLDSMKETQEFMKFEEGFDKIFKILDTGSELTFTRL